LPAFVTNPGIAQGVFCRADGNDLAADTQDGRVFDYAELSEFRATPGIWITAKSEKLANIDEEQGADFHGSRHS